MRAGKWLSQLGHKGGAQQPLIELVLDKRVDPDAQRMALRNFGLSKIEQDARKHADKEVRQLLERVAERSRQLMGSDGDSSL